MRNVDTNIERICEETSDLRLQVYKIKESFEKETLRLVALIKSAQLLEKDLRENLHNKTNKDNTEEQQHEEERVVDHEDKDYIRSREIIAAIETNIGSLNDKADKLTELRPNSSHRHFSTGHPSSSKYSPGKGDHHRTIEGSPFSAGLWRRFLGVGLQRTHDPTSGIPSRLHTFISELLVHHSPFPFPYDGRALQKTTLRKARVSSARW
ncbi:hypothetical protein MTP99_009643 [Tenebrio molitor]|nr:hypothetical protein MTP99_009643 [Tenebrio molitor]